MSRIVSQSAAAFAAVFITAITISAIVVVPEAATFSALPALA